METQEFYFALSPKKAKSPPDSKKVDFPNSTYRCICHWGTSTDGKENSEFMQTQFMKQLQYDHPRKGALFCFREDTSEKALAFSFRLAWHHLSPVLLQKHLGYHKKLLTNEDSLFWIMASTFLKLDTKLLDS